jgi:hypothetical protein
MQFTAFIYLEVLMSNMLILQAPGCVSTSPPSPYKFLQGQGPPVPCLRPQVCCALDLLLCLSSLLIWHLWGPFPLINRCR